MSIRSRRSWTAAAALVALAATSSAQTTTRISVDSAGNQANGLSFVGHSFSGDSRYVVFFSEASNLVSGDTNGVTDVFVRDQGTGETTRVSVASGGGQGSGGESRGGTLSSDGLLVAFGSAASNLVPGWPIGMRDSRRREATCSRSAARAWCGSCPSIRSRMRARSRRAA